LFAIVLLWTAGMLKRRSGLPSGEIVYRDHDRLKRDIKPMYDASLGLTGKPDYLVQKNKFLIPVEIKSSWAPISPYDSHIFQLAAYCILVEKKYNSRPPYGLLQYRNRTFKIEFTQSIEEQVYDLIDEIRSKKNSEIVDRSHQQKNRCARCSFRHICDQRL